MKFTKLKLGNETQCVLTEKIGRWSVTSHRCESCGMTHYVLDVYDHKGVFLFSMKGSKKKMEKLSKQISDDINSVSKTIKVKII
jgi:hypothetical protein